MSTRLIREELVKGNLTLPNEQTSGSKDVNGERKMKEVLGIYQKDTIETR